MAAHKLLLWLTEHGPEEGSKILIRPDSLLVIKWLTGVARAGHHKELIKECRAALTHLSSKYEIRWKHVRAHRNHYWNEMVDEHAKAGADGHSASFVHPREQMRVLQELDHTNTVPRNRWQEKY